LTSALVEGEWSTSRPGRFALEEGAPGTLWIGGWVGPRADLDDLEKRKFLTLLGLELKFSVVQPVASLYTDGSIGKKGKVNLSLQLILQRSTKMY
jgi:hypothetical protein